MSLEVGKIIIIRSCLLSNPVCIPVVNFKSKLIVFLACLTVTTIEFGSTLCLKIKEIGCNMVSARLVLFTDPS